MKIRTFTKIQYILALISVGVLFNLLIAEPEGGAKSSLGRLDTGTFDGNRIKNDLENNGMIVSHRLTGHSGMEWPAGTNKYSNFASGIWFAGKVNDEIRTAVAEYGPEFVSGAWGSDPNGDDELYIVNKSDLADPLSSSDFQNWPAHLGAPWVDNDGDGVYSPLPNGTDHPEFIGDQVIWYVMNDGDAGSHTIFGTDPLGIEVRVTIWGYNRPDAFGDMMFVKAQAYNMGGNEITDMYIGLWDDPDLGYAGDDFVGCDIELSLGYCYNDGADSDYGAAAPAIGYDFFQASVPGPSGSSAFAFGENKAGFQALEMSSFTKYINGDPVYSDPTDEIETYYYMSGYKKDGTPFIDSETGLESKFVHPCDPNNNTGASDGCWVDSDDNASGDRRFLMNVGPFNFAPGDSAELVFGIMHAQGSDPLNSITLLKQVDKLAQLAYDIQFALPPSPAQPEVSTTSSFEEIILNWDDAAESYTAVDELDLLPVASSWDTTWVTEINLVTTQDTVIAGDETIITTDSSYTFTQIIDDIVVTYEGEPTSFAFEGYNVWQHENIAGTGARKLLATYDLVNGITEIFDDVFDAAYGSNVNIAVQSGSDSGIKRWLSIDKDYLSGGTTLIPERIYYYTVNSYGYNQYGIPKTLESADNIFSIRPQKNAMESATVDVGYSDFTVEHTAGGSDGTISVSVVNPFEITGDSYELYFDTGYYYRDVDGIWKPTAYADSVGRVLSRSSDCSGSTITAAALASATVGTVDLTFTFDMDCGDNWVDGIVLDLPDDFTINSWDSAGDCSYPSYGQNCVNLEGTLDAITNTITWGDDARSEFGAFEGGQAWTVNIALPTNYPFDVAYTVYDDNYDGTTVDATGTATVTELGYEFKSIQQWNVLNTTTGILVVADQTMVSGVYYENIVDGVIVEETAELGEVSNPIFDGLQVVVNGPTNGIHGVWQTANANGAIDGADVDVNENIMWINFLTAPDYPTEQAQGGWFFFVHGGGTPNDMESFYARVFRGSNFSRAIPYDFEMRFTTDALATGLGYKRFEDGLILGDVPFELWNIGSSTPDDASDDYRMLPAVLNYGGDNDDAYDFGGEDGHSGAANDPSSDWVYWGNPDDMSPGQAGYDAFHAPGIGNEPTGGWTEVIARTRLMNWNGYVSHADSVLLTTLSDVDPANWTAADTAIFIGRDWFLDAGNDLAVITTAGEYAYGLVLDIPEIGTVYRMITNKPNTTADKFTFGTSDAAPTSMAYSCNDIGVWPNPYFGYNPEERNVVDNQIRFIGLSTNATIRIYDLAGNLVRKLAHSSGSDEVWDVKNNFNITVASGMYIATVEANGCEKLLKIAIVAPEQRIDVY